MRRLVATLVVSASAVALGACSAEEPMPGYRVLQGGAPGEQPVELTEMPTIPDPEITADEVTFVRHMIVHHGQALRMTELVPERSARKDVPLFAERIHLSQEDEIRLMEEWLQEHRVAALLLDQEAGRHDGHATPTEMPGMVTEAQLAELREASGEEFDRLFLELMYAHHEGAVQMVETLYQGEQSSEPVLFNLAREIDGDQRIEMDRIVGMLNEMDTEAGGR